LRIDDVIVTNGRSYGTAMIDFRVLNVGGSEVSINKISFVLLEERSVALGALHRSGEYTIEFEYLFRIGDHVETETAQLVRPGEVDRFGVEVGANFHHKQSWTVEALLITNYGEIKSRPISLTLP
jgi:hypothetical protein